MKSTPLYCSILAVVVGLASSSPIAIPEQPDIFNHLRVGLPGAHNKRQQLVDILGYSDELKVEVDSGRTSHKPHVIENQPFFLPVNRNDPLSRGQPVHHPCAGARSRAMMAKLRYKSIEISNAFRQMFGLPLIKVDGIEGVKIPVPMHGHGRLPEGVSANGIIHNAYPSQSAGEWRVIRGEWRVIRVHEHHPSQFQAHPHPHPYPYHGHRGSHGYGRFGPNHGSAPFLMRLHGALMSLGPWEGRAVAFVLGCGIGVLIRMIWVLAVVSYRTFNPATEEGQQEEGYLRLEGSDDAEEIFVAPPLYVVDDKVPVYEEREEGRK